MPGSQRITGTDTGIGPGGLTALAAGELKLEKGVFKRLGKASNDETREVFMQELRDMEGRVNDRFARQDERFERVEGDVRELQLWRAEVKGPIGEIVRRMQRYVHPLTILTQALSAAIILVTLVGLLYQLFTGQPLIQPIAKVG